MIQQCSVDLLHGSVIRFQAAHVNYTEMSFKQFACIKWIIYASHCSGNCLKLKRSLNSEM